MATRFPAFQFYPNEWLSSGTRKKMTLEAQGAYMNLLAIYWSENCKGLPTRSTELAKLAEIQGDDAQVCAVLAQVIATSFKEKDGLLHNKKLKKQFKDLVKLSRIRSLTGKLGGRPKKQTESESKANKSSSVFSLQSSSSSSEEKKEEEKKSQGQEWTGGVLDHLFKVAKGNKITARDDTLRSWIEGWERGYGAAKTEQALVANAGKSVVVVSKWLEQGESNAKLSGIEAFAKRHGDAQ